MEQQNAILKEQLVTLKEGYNNTQAQRTKLEVDIADLSATVKENEVRMNWFLSSTNLTSLSCKAKTISTQE